LFLGKRRLDVQYLPGHTGGDSVVILRDANIVFCGDLFWRKTLPNLVDATTSDWIPSLSTLAELSDEAGSADAPVATYVPGHGDVGNLADLEDFQNYLINLRFMLEKPVQDGFKGDALVAAVFPELTKQYGSWNLFKHFSRSNILDTGAELEGTKRVPLDEKK
jgi:glyoxylase-like metal-dependent hydrolase (beta-lactamase superfamily II)